MSIKRPEILPFAVPFDQEIKATELPDTDMLVDPEALICSVDHAGVWAALNLLPPRQQQIFCQKTGINESGTPLSSAAIADKLGISVETVSSTLTRARNRLRAVDNIFSIINGEYISADNPLQTS